jgi:hypothetical protein
MRVVPGPEKRNDTCGKTMHVEMMDRGFTLYITENFKLTNSVVQEPEGSSPHSQQPATGPCPELVKSNPHPPSQSP